MHEAWGVHSGLVPAAVGSAGHPERPRKLAGSGAVCSAPPFVAWQAAGPLTAAAPIGFNVPLSLPAGGCGGPVPGHRLWIDRAQPRTYPKLNKPAALGPRAYCRYNRRFFIMALSSAMSTNTCPVQIISVMTGSCSVYGRSRASRPVLSFWTSLDGASRAMRRLIFRSFLERLAEQWSHSSHTQSKDFHHELLDL